MTKLVEGYILAGDVETGLAATAKALAFMQRIGEHFAESDLHRLKGELLLLRGADVAAEASFHQAIKIARQQQARLWELRAATSLSRLWRQQGREKEARQSLAELSAWFSEGWELPDLQAARALLE
jgi:predicted ATPase